METFLPTPSQAENDLAATGQLPAVKDYDGSPIDPSSHNPAVPGAPGAPHITSLTPNTGALPSAPIAVVVNGTNFTTAAKIHFNANAIATTYTSATALGCSITAAEAGNAPGSFPLRVEDKGGYSNTVQFTFTATARSGRQQGVKSDDGN
jgi:IPT/TIG domain